jgi:hypothetical protein
LTPLNASIAKVTKILNPEYLPVSLSVNSQTFRADLNEWFGGRSIPASRDGLRDALDRISQISDECYFNKNQLIIKALGLSLSDQYWINPEGNLSWEEVNFFNNPFSDDVGEIFFGGVAADDKELDFMSPDNTSDGWLKKRWRIIDEKRCLIKAGSGVIAQEPVNEALASKMLEKLGTIPYVKYELHIAGDKPFCVCENFITPETELVTANQISNYEKRPNHVSKYEHLLNCCAKLGINGAREYMDFMLVFDNLIMNEDRHLNNFGAIRNVDTLKFEGMAPLFDSGTSFWNNEIEPRIAPHSPFKTRPFNESPAEQLKKVSSFEGFDVAKLKGMNKVFEELLLKVPSINDSRKEKLYTSFAIRLEDFEQVLVRDGYWS